MNRTAIATGLLAALCAIGAHATPLRLDYSIAETSDLIGGFDFGTYYRYDFTLVLDDNDGSWVAGQEFDWFVFGDGPTGSAFDSTWDWHIPGDPTLYQHSTSGGHNGPTIGYAGSVVLPGFAPTALGESIEFSFRSRTFLGAGDLLWSNLVSSPGATNASFATANYISAVPLPASGLMLLAGLGAAAAARRKR